jgi:hypothetical protein
MTTEDWAFLLAFLNASVALNAAIIIAWGRHGEQAPRVFGVPVVQFVKFDGNYMQAIQHDDPLSGKQRDALCRMIADGCNLSTIPASRYGMKRAEWVQVRYWLVEVLRLGEYRDGRGVVLNSSGYDYLGVPLPRWIESAEFTGNYGDNTTCVYTTQTGEVVA